MFKRKIISSFKEKWKKFKCWQKFGVIFFVISSFLQIILWLLAITSHREGGLVFLLPIIVLEFPGIIITKMFPNRISSNISPFLSGNIGLFLFVFLSSFFYAMLGSIIGIVVYKSKSLKKKRTHLV